MAKKRPFFEFILQVINLFFTVSGIGALGYGLICFFKWRHTLPKEIHHENSKYMIVHRLLLADQQSSESDRLPKTWFIYFTIGIGVILLIVSCLGYAGTATRSPCCLLSYSMFLIALIILELGTAIFVFFDHSWDKIIPEDTSGDYHTIYNFVDVHWKVMRWIALGVYTLQVIALILALYLQSVFKSAWYDESDHEERVVYLPRGKHNYRVLTPTRITIPSSTSDVNARDQANLTSPSNTGANVNARDPTNTTRDVVV